MANILSKSREHLMLACISIGLVLWLLIADNLIKYAPFAPRTFWALFDVLINGTIALLITHPLFGMRTHLEKTVLLFCLVFFTATLLDVDHFIAAHSLDISSALALELRPPTHSLTFAGIAGIIVGMIFRDFPIGWGVFAALASHILRDASAGITPLIWPLPIKAIPWWIYYPAEVILLLLSFLISQGGR